MTGKEAMLQGIEVTDAAAKAACDVLIGRKDRVNVEWARRGVKAALAELHADFLIACRRSDEQEREIERLRATIARVEALAEGWNFGCGDELRAALKGDNA